MRLKHPISRADYTRNDDGTVTVTRRSGKSAGTFDRKGRWIVGELRVADPLMCLYVSDGFSTRPGSGNTVIDGAIKAQGTSA